MPAGLDPKQVILRVFSLRKQPAFSLRDMAVLVRRANKPRWARAVELRGFLFFSLLRRSFARFCGFAAQCATDISAQVTGNRSQVQVTVLR